VIFDARSDRYALGDGCGSTEGGTIGRLYLQGDQLASVQSALPTEPYSAQAESSYTKRSYTRFV
jgi:hypothetical protein